MLVDTWQKSCTKILKTAWREVCNVWLEWDQSHQILPLLHPVKSFMEYISSGWRLLTEVHHTKWWVFFCYLRRLKSYANEIKNSSWTRCACIIHYTGVRKEEIVGVVKRNVIILGYDKQQYIQDDGIINCYGKLVDNYPWITILGYSYNFSDLMLSTIPSYYSCMLNVCTDPSTVMLCYTIYICFCNLCVITIYAVYLCIVIIDFYWEAYMYTFKKNWYPIPKHLCCTKGRA